MQYWTNTYLQHILISAVLHTDVPAALNTNILSPFGICITGFHVLIGT